MLTRVFPADLRVSIPSHPSRLHRPPSDLEREERTHSADDNYDATPFPALVLDHFLSPLLLSIIAALVSSGGVRS